MPSDAAQESSIPASPFSRPSLPMFCPLGLPIDRYGRRSLVLSRKTSSYSASLPEVEPAGGSGCGCGLTSDVLTFGLYRLPKQNSLTPLVEYMAAAKRMPPQTNDAPPARLLPSGSNCIYRCPQSIHGQSGQPRETCSWLRGLTDRAAVH